MPRRYYNYLDQFQPLHVFSTVGSWIIGLEPVHDCGDFARFAPQADGCARQPLGRNHLEWETSSPPITHNFEEQPVLEHEPYDYRPKAVAH